MQRKVVKNFIEMLLTLTPIEQEKITQKALFIIGLKKYYYKKLSKFFLNICS